MKHKSPGSPLPAIRHSLIHRGEASPPIEREHHVESIFAVCAPTPLATWTERAGACGVGVTLLTFGRLSWERVQFVVSKCYPACQLLVLLMPLILLIMPPAV